MNRNTKNERSFEAYLVPMPRYGYRIFVRGRTLDGWAHSASLGLELLKDSVYFDEGFKGVSEGL